MTIKKNFTYNFYRYFICLHYEINIDTSLNINLYFQKHLMRFDL